VAAEDLNDEIEERLDSVRVAITDGIAVIGGSPGSQ
jgi:hypothetical protein